MANSQKSNGADAISMLKTDHRKVAGRATHAMKKS